MTPATPPIIDLLAWPDVKPLLDEAAVAEAARAVALRDVRLAPPSEVLIRRAKAKAATNAALAAEIAAARALKAAGGQ